MAYNELLNGKYGHIKYDVRDYLGITNNAFLLLDFVAKMQGRPSEENPGYCNASPDYLAAIVGIDKRNYFALCNRIESLGLAERHPKTRKIRVTLAVYDLICGTGDVSSLPAKSGDVSSPNPVMIHHQTGDDSSLHYNIVYNTVDNTIPLPLNLSLPLEEKKEKEKTPPAPAKKKAPGHQPVDVFNELNQDAKMGQFFRDVWHTWKDYLEHRKEMKAKCKPFASAKSEALAVKALYEISNGNIETCKLIVKQSRVRQWVALIAIKEETVASVSPGPSKPANLPVFS